MAVFNEPTKWAQTLGKDADVTTIPDTAGETDPSIDKIFPSVFSIPLARGGRAIPRSVLNGLFKLLGDWSFYQQNGGIASYSNTFDYAVGSFVKYNNELYLCIQENGASSPKIPTNTSYWSKIPTLSDFDEIGFNTGDIKIQTTAIIPSGWLLCNGARVSRSTFSNLFTKIGTTYGTGDGSTTFNIPDLRDRYIIGANTNALGTYIAEQLPNINGSFQTRPTKSSSDTNVVATTLFPTGAFSASTSTQNWTAQLGTTVVGTIPQPNGIATVYSAHNSNAVYTDSGKVYPLSLALNFIIKT